MTGIDVREPDITRKPGLTAVVVCLALLLLAALATGLSSHYIASAFPDRPAPRDLLFEALPYVDAAQYSGDVIYAMVALLLIDGIRRKPRKIPGMVSVFALMYLLRAGLMILTPLASAHGNGTLYGFIPIVQNGMWPSGHAAAALLCALLADENPKWLRRVMGILATVVGVSLIVGHAHYSIDVVGGLLLAYFVQREWSQGSLFRPLKNLTDK